MDVYCRPTDLEEQSEIFHRELEGPSYLHSWSSWKTSITPVSDGIGTAQHGINHTRHSWSDNFLNQVRKKPECRAALLDFVLWHKEGWYEYESQRQPWLPFPWDGGVQDPGGRKKSKKKVTTLTSRHQELAWASRLILKQSHYRKPWLEESPKRNGWCSGLMSCKLRGVYPNKQEDRQNTWGPAWGNKFPQNSDMKRSIWRVETRTGNLVGIKRHCLSMETCR